MQVDLNRLAKALSAQGIDAHITQDFLFVALPGGGRTIWDGTGECPALAFAMLGELRKAYVFWIKSDQAPRRLKDSQCDFFWAVASLDRIDIQTLDTRWLAERFMLLHNAGLLSVDSQEVRTDG